MTQRRGSWLLLLYLVAGAAPLPARAPSALAAEAQADAPVDLVALERERMKRAALYPVRKRVSRYLEAATKAVDQGKPDEGRALLAKLEPKVLNPYERALVYRLQAHLAYFAGDYALARDDFEKVLAEQVLPVRDDNRIRFNIAQLYAAKQEWREAITALDRWQRYVAEPDPFAHYLRAVAYYQLDEPDAALDEAKQAVELTPEPMETWLQLLSALYTQRGDYASAVPILDQLVTRFPTKKQHWVQLALIYAAQEDYKRSLAVQLVAYQQGLLTEDKDLKRLVRGYLHQSIPYQAAQVLEKALADGAIPRDSQALELLGNSWVAAREYEKSLGPLRQAAELAKDGNLYVRLAQVYMQREAWPEASEVLQQAIAKGGLREPGTAQLLLGICYYNDHRVDQARSSFARAREHESTREAAERWINTLEQSAS